MRACCSKPRALLQNWLGDRNLRAFLPAMLAVICVSVVPEPGHCRGSRPLGHVEFDFRVSKAAKAGLKRNQSSVSFGLSAVSRRLQPPILTELPQQNVTEGGVPAACVLRVFRQSALRVFSMPCLTRFINTRRTGRVSVPRERNKLIFLLSGKVVQCKSGIPELAQDVG